MKQTFVKQNVNQCAATELPLSEPIELTAIDAFMRLAHLPHVVFFDSATHSGEAGRYSFVATDPFCWLEVPPAGSDALALLQEKWHPYRTATCDGLPPFQGGWAGLFGYDLARSLEKIPAAAIDDFPMPALAVGCYDVVIAFDHQQNKAWIVSQGFPETDAQARHDRAKARLAQFRQLLFRSQKDPKDPVPEHLGDNASKPLGELAPQFDVGHGQITSNFSSADYRQMIRRAVDYIHAGDVFQVNLAQRLLCPASSSALKMYLRLRQCNPAPYAGFFDLGNQQICSASPECFLTLRDGQVETRPIKGTRGRWGNSEADLFAGDDLLQSEKDRAENVMIVDLLRNDLSRICTPGSVQVTALCQLETYAYVKHLVSVVQGTLAATATPIDLLRACFPGGSITGAPKPRAMEIIAELEPTARGAYCGSLGYLGFDGQLDSSILIRTITAAEGWWQLSVGGGIVAQSDPEDEYRETWHKAEGMLRALE